MKNQSVGNRIDYISILLYIALVIMGWMTIYSASLPLEETSIFDISQIYGRQMLFIGLTIPIIFIILFTFKILQISAELKCNKLISRWTLGELFHFSVPVSVPIYLNFTIGTPIGTLNCDKICVFWHITKKEKTL